MIVKNKKGGQFFLESKFGRVLWHYLFLKIQFTKSFAVEILIVKLIKL
jgi:hypothetical protein